MWIQKTAFIPTRWKLSPHEAGFLFKLEMWDCPDVHQERHVIADIAHQGGQTKITGIHTKYKGAKCPRIKTGEELERTILDCLGKALRDVETSAEEIARRLIRGQCIFMDGTRRIVYKVEENEGVLHLLLGKWPDMFGIESAVTFLGRFFRLGLDVVLLGHAFYGMEALARREDTPLARIVGLAEPLQDGDETLKVIFTLTGQISKRVVV